MTQPLIQPSQLDLTALGPVLSVTTVGNLSGDTQIQVEETLNEDIIRFDTGDGVTGWPANDNTLLLSSGAFTLALPTANVASTSGADINMTAGDGNLEAGGDVFINSGDGASDSGGTIQLRAGIKTGNTATSGGELSLGGGQDDNDGGNTTLRGGDSSSGGSGGNLFLEGGDAAIASTDGGNVTLRGGNITTGSGNAGNVSILGGDTLGTGPGGDITIASGDSGTSGDPGTFISITAGDGGDNGGPINITTGSGGTNDDGGPLNLLGGSGDGVGDGGTINLDGGPGGATGDGGDIAVTPGSTTAGEEGTTQMFGVMGVDHQALGTVTAATDIDPNSGLSADFTFGAAATAEVGITTFKNTNEIGVELTVEVTNGGQGTLTWGAEISWAGGSAPTLTAAGTDLIKFWSRDGGTTWIGWVVALDVS